MITFPTTPEAFIAYQEATFCRKFDAFSREMADLYVDLFNLEFDAGVKGLDPINIAKSTAEFYMKYRKSEGFRETHNKRYLYECPALVQ